MAYTTEKGRIERRLIMSDTYNNYNGNDGNGNHSDENNVNNTNMANVNAPADSDSTMVNTTADMEPDYSHTTAGDSVTATGTETEGTASGEGSQESSSTYGYSYINQEHKNPYTVWRADENTAGAYTDNAGSSYGTARDNSQYGSGSYQGYGGTQPDQNGWYHNNAGYGAPGSQQGGGYNGQYNNGGAYGATQAGNTGTYGSAQNGGDYSSIYGNGDSQAGYTTDTDAKKQKREERARKRAEKAAGASQNFGVKLAKCASIALIFGLVSGTVFEGSRYLTGGLLGTDKKEVVTTTEHTQKETVQQPAPDSGENVAATPASSGADVSAIVEACMPSIVSITNLSQVQVQNFFGQVQNYEVPSAGSGVIIGEDDNYLYIVTNNHVVESNSGSSSQGVEYSTTLTIQFEDKTTASAEIKGTDRSSDLAVVKVNKSDIEKETLSRIKIATLGDSDNVKVGSQAIAIGNALGYGQSVTGGWVSALNREVTIQDEKTRESFTNELIQTDAAINPGNSGGALLNNKGEVIGINSSKYSDTDVEGMGFAIPSNTAKPIIEDLIKREVVTDDDKAAFLGIVGADVTSTISQTYNIPEGICITEVSKGTAAEKYGLQRGDIITKFDGKAVKSYRAFQNMITYYEAGSEVEIEIYRAGEGGYQQQTVKVVLGKKNA